MSTTTQRIEVTLTRESFEEYLRRTADSICAALDLTVEQADGARPMRGDDLFEVVRG